jgi:hypothetical protein
MVKFSVQPEEWITVRDSPDRTAAIVGYTKRIIGGQQTGTIVEGGQYTNVDTAAPETRWLSAQVALWDEERVEKTDEASGEQARATGYFSLNFITLEETIAVPVPAEEPRVLGITSDEPQGTGRVAGTLELVEVEGESGAAAEVQAVQVPIGSSGPREAVVNRQFLQVLGIAEDAAVDTTFSVSFVVISSLLADATQKIESAPETYTIVGVLPEEEAPAMYVPFIHTRSLGAAAYSQAKVVVTTQQAVPDIRRNIEAMGYATSSALDTVEQINQFFATARVLLATVGSVALVIAALGMFNTLTVSLLERTHEVGLMKAIGMKSREVRKLFLVESLTMGFLGGVLGLLLGYIGGWILSALLSSIALGQGSEAVIITSFPPLLILGVMTLALVVGIATGLYPARRATKISALNALRYE